jgi:glutathione S-transferase
VPAAEIDGTVITESGAICHWLSDRFPELGLAPMYGSSARMQYEKWMFYAPGTLEPLPFLIILHSAILPESERLPDIVRWATKSYLPVLKVLNTELEEKDYLLGERFSSADIMVGSTLMWLPDLLRKQPALQTYVERLQNRAAYQRAVTDPSPNA